MTQLYLIRHGDYIETFDGLLCDRGLTRQGIEQAEQLRDRLRKPEEFNADILISSTMLRARETAEIIAPALSIPIVYDPDVEEWRNDNEQTSPAEFLERIKATPSDQIPFFQPVPGAETLAEFMFRACTALNRITQQHAGKRIVIVCHGGVIEASFVLFFGLSPVQPQRTGLHPHHTSITHWYQNEHARAPFMWTLERYNDIAHLHDSYQTQRLPS